MSVYAAGATTPSLTLSQGLSEPASVVVDGQGNVWVTNEGNQPSIVVYPPGQTTPSQTITGNLIQMPQQLTFDAAGDAFFADNIAGVSEILAGTTQATSLNLGKLLHNATNGIAIDPRNGTLFVSFGFFHNQLNAYGAGHTRPKRILTAPTADSLAVATFLGHEDLFVPGSQTNTVSIFHAGANSAFASFSIATQYTRSVAFKPAGVP